MSQRVVRLVSAGVPISSAFQAAVEEIIDNGSSDFDSIQKRVEEVMRFKEARILREAGWRTWTDFTADITEQLIERKTVTYLNGKYTAPEFVFGAEYKVIPYADPPVTFTVWDEATRLKRDREARWLMDVKRLHSEHVRLLDKLTDADEDLVTRARRLVGISGSMEKILNGQEVKPLPDKPDGSLPPKVQKRVRTGIADAVDQYVREYPDFWFKDLTIMEFWNQRHPDQEPLTLNDASTIRRRLREGTGTIFERRGPKGAYEYRKARTY